MLYAIGSQGKEDEAKKITPTNEEKPVTAEPKKEEAKAEEKEESGESNRVIKSVGEGVQTENFKIVVESLKKVKSDNQFIAPSEGKAFVAVGLLIENISDKDYTVSSILMFNAYQDGFSINEDLTAHAIKGFDKTMDGALAAGKKIKGYLIYEVEKDWKELEVDIDLTKLSFSNDGEVKLKLANK